MLNIKLINGDVMTFTVASLLPTQWQQRFLDYRLGINDEDRKRFKSMEQTLQKDLIDKTSQIAQVLDVDQDQVGFGNELFVKFQAQMKMMSKDSRLATTAERIEILGHAFFASHFQEYDLNEGCLDDFVSKRNKATQKSVLDAFPEEEKSIAKKYLAMHPRFYTVAKKNFWLLALMDIAPQNLDKEKRPMHMEDGQLKIKVQGDDKEYKISNWTDLENGMDGDFNKSSLPYRLVQRGLAKGKNDDFYNLEPFKEVNSHGRCVFQSITSLLRSAPFTTPVGVSMGNTGHVFSQIILPQEEGDKSDVYSWGLFVGDWKHLGEAGPLATFSASVKSPDDHWTRIVEPNNSKGYVAIVKEYELSDDKEHDICLFAYANESDYKDLQDAMRERNSESFDKVVERLQRSKENLSGAPKLFTKEEKAKLLLHLVDGPLRKDRDFQALLGNCSVENQWQEKFVIKLLGASYHEGSPVRVYDNQMSHQDVKITLKDRISNLLVKSLIFVASCFPWSGIGKTHPSAPRSPVMSRGDALKIPKGERPNTTFESVSRPTNVPEKGRIQRLKDAFWRFVNYLRGAELPNH